MTPPKTSSRSIDNLRQTPLAACLALAMGLAVAAPTASAAPNGSGNTLVVANCADSGFGSLRAALGAAVNGDIVDLSQLSCSTITLDTPVSTSVNHLTLQGAPTAKYGAPTITSAAANTDGLIRHTGSGLLSIENLTLLQGHKVSASQANGACVSSTGSVHMLHSAAKYCVAENTSGGAAHGGAIWTSGNAILVGSVIRNNEAKSQSGNAAGGGLWAGGSLDAKYSSIQGNTAVSVSGISQAGGAWGHEGGMIDGSTISGNKAGIVGGLMLGPSSLSAKIENSTISGNTSVSDGAATAGVWIAVNDNLAMLENNTITDNVNYDNHSAGLYIYGNDNNTTLTSNIISGNRYFITESNGERKYSQSDLGQSTGVTISGSHNLVGRIDSEVLLPTDTIKQEDTPLGPLQVNGGGMAWLPSHEIGTGSWAFNSGTTVDNGTFDPPESADQNGDPREIGSATDIGAIESDALFLGRFEDPPRF